MCHASDYAHLLEGEPSPEERAAMAQIPQEPERRPRDVSGEPREWVAWSDHLGTDYLAGFPLVEDAEVYARTLVFGQRGRVACERPSFDPYWCIVHSHDFADGAGACEAAR